MRDIIEVIRKTTSMDEIKKIQVEMHADFFDRCKVAIEQGFYLEAIFMEYAAIEARLESLCGVAGLPCGKNCKCRKDIKISHRIECLRAFYNYNTSITSGTKLPNNFFSKKGELRTWTDGRNRFVHGLYKDEIKYKDRIISNKDLAEDGYEYARLLYNETKRLRRMRNNHGDSWSSVVDLCKMAACKGYLSSV